MDPLPKVSLKCFENDPFAVMQKGSTLREIYDQLIADENFPPHILLETRSCHTLFNMVVEGICCSVFPISYAKNYSNVSFFSIEQYPVWEVAASYKKGSYLSSAANDLIVISTEYWSRKMNTF
jgi:DNA-binding transcriptional LysR family regulator